jgi:hypothetical protein
MVGMCEEGVVIPIVTMFYNEAATADILKCKRDAQEHSASFDKRFRTLKQLQWYSVLSRVKGFAKLLWERVVYKISVWQLQPDDEDVQRCLESPEFRVLTYLHKLTHRMASWRSFSAKRLDLKKLPSEFRIAKGPTDPPHAEYSHLVRIQDLINAYIPKDLQNTLLAVIIAEKFTHARQLDPAHRECVPWRCVSQLMMRFVCRN